MKCTFCGHDDISYTEMYDDIKQAIKNLIEEGVTTFYSACETAFDLECIKAVGELKDLYPAVENYIVTAYNDDDHLHRYCFVCKFFRAETMSTINHCTYGSAPYQYRNKWILDNSDCILAYVTCTKDIAFATLKSVKKNRRRHLIKIYNLADKT